MSGVLAISGLALAGLAGAVVIAIAFTGGLIYLSLRGRRRIDIPKAMGPGPADETLERRHLERVMGWGILFVLFFAVWLPVFWLAEPSTNANDERELIDRSVDRGRNWFAVADADNPTGFSCAQCHGQNAEGGQVAFQGQAYPAPSLTDVCSRLTIEDPGGIRETIEQGREGTPMPSWSVDAEGPMNDQQIDDLIAFIVSIQEIPEEENLCLDPALAEEQAEGGE